MKDMPSLREDAQDRGCSDPATPPMVAALFVQTGGCYFGLPGVDPWDLARDARKYAGPHPVVAHPPCERWGRYWGGSPTTWPRLTKGDDGGCFAAALAAVRACGGVIEHPEGSHAWRAFGIRLPDRGGGWTTADLQGGWTCCVEQGAYGHPARKATWLYVFGLSRRELPELKWGRAEGEFHQFEAGFHSADERAKAKAAGFVDYKAWRAFNVKKGIVQRLSKNQRLATPAPFRDLLLSIARSARQPMAEAA